MKTSHIDLDIEEAQVSDLPKILEVQKKGFLSEAKAHNKYDIHALVQTLDELVEECSSKVVLKAIVDNKIVGTIRANSYDEGVFLNKLSVLEEYRHLGIGLSLLNAIEREFPNATKFSLGTAAKSTWNIQFYEKSGYKIVKYLTFEDGSEGVIMEKNK